MKNDQDDPVILVSSDSHIGPRLVDDLRPYCPASYLEEFDRFAAKYGAKYDKAVACLIKDRGARLAFDDFPAEPLGRPGLPSCGTDHRRCR